MQVLGEPPLLLTTPNIRVNATQMASIDNSLFSLGDVVFHMPVNLEEELRAASGAKEGSCYGAMMTVYKENPFYSEMVRVVVNPSLMTVTRDTQQPYWKCAGFQIEQLRHLARHFTLTVPLCTQEYKWVPANCQGNLTKCWGVTCDGLASHLGGVAILLVSSC